MNKVIVGAMIFSMLLLSNAVAYSNGDSVKIGGYSNNSYWRGTIYETSDNNYKVKVTDVVTNGMFMLWFNPGTCTGGEQLGTSQIGTFVWIPKHCVS